MEVNINDLNGEADELFNQEKFDEVIELLTDEVLEQQKDAGLYVTKGAAWYNKKDYDKAIKDYNEAINISSNYELAFYNRGLAWFAKKEYDKAIEDYSNAIKHNPDYKDEYYLNRGHARKAKEEYEKAIYDYTKAIKINPDFENAYYSRGLARKERKIAPQKSKQDFEKYLELTIGKDETSIKYAKYYIEELEVRIKNKKLSAIADLIAKIKDMLLISENCVTHYTSLSTLKSLILDSSEFRISEGNFMNDPSEGKEFFNFLEYKPDISCKDGSIFEKFSPKPFIGSFVPKDKNDDLNMWRFYGKENGVEAKGCAITLRMQDFIDYIKDFTSNEKNKDARPDDESDIQFYRVAYVIQNEPNKFYIPNSDKSKSKELNTLIEELKKEVKSYKVKDRTALEKYLNSIAFLFKNDAYKNENEVRLVIQGIGLPKKYNLNSGTPNVYIELTSIKDIVEQITLGPKVDTKNEWASAFHYSYKSNAPEIRISLLPYK